MATRVVGLDIGSYAVRAAELALGGNQPTLERFAQVTLPPGAVRNGEVVDAAAVASSIRRLWSEGGFKSKRVIVGVANQRVVVRQAELPSMSEADLESALRFEAQELIPIPIEDAILDFQILGDTVGADGEPRMRVLLAAAQRDMVRSHVAAVEGAGLATAAVDVIPFALVRSATLGSSYFESDGGAEAVVCIGGGVTNVVVHEQGVPRFVRVLLVGGDDITEAIARELNVDLDIAEDLKRRAAAGGGDDAVARAGQIVSSRLNPLVEEIRGSIDYYSAQTQSAPITRVLVTGGASRTPGLMERLQAQLGSRVEPAHPLAGLRVGPIGIDESQLAELEPLLAVPVGLALAGEVQKGVRRISLLPREIAAVRVQRRQTGAALVGVGALAVILLALWAARSAQGNDEQEKADDAEAEVVDLQRERAQHAGATGLQAEVTQREAQFRQVLADDVAWTKIFNEVASVIPDDVWLVSFVGQKGASGTVNVTGQGFDHTSTARWLLRAADIKSFSGVWVANSTVSGTGRNTIVNFTSQANLTPSARSNRLDTRLRNEPS
ncbi:MAG TPA: type IV pilus assembly protein PilM [Acidimicrobiales bacterium]|nr:type IV pilus assembly protein PilM [Acidimicrobiales bacterium]